VTWTVVGSAATYEDYIGGGDGLNQAARARKRLRAAVVDGSVAASVVPPQRGSEVAPMALEHGPGGFVPKVR
jgi:hypothetical protein